MKRIKQEVYLDEDRIKWEESQGLKLIQILTEFIDKLKEIK